jgi:hypothetical protein
VRSKCRGNGASTCDDAARVIVVAKEYTIE